MLSLAIIFNILLFSVFNSYVFYPFTIYLISLFRKIGKQTEYSPSISILISAYNEEKVIRQRILNILELNYDMSKVEILVGSDCSDDNTLEILEEICERVKNLKVYAFKERRGKASVLNDLVNEARHDILVFTDANTVFEKNSLGRLVKGFADEQVGGISGRLILSDEKVVKNESVEEKKYWQYETLIKRSEGRCGILIGANGGIFAIRKALFRSLPFKKAVTDDFYITLSVLSQGYEFRYEYDAVAYEDVGHSVATEFKRKVRFVATNFQTIFFFKDLLINRNFLLSYAFITHKIIRWFLPVIMLALYILNIPLLTLGFYYQLVFIFQNLFYLLALCGYILALCRIKINIFSVPYFFIIANIALVVGFFRFIRGKHSIIWQSTPR